MPESAEPARLVNVRRFLMGFSTGNSADVLSLLSPDVVYTVPGHGSMAGVYRGPAEVSEHIGKLFRLTSGTFEVLKWIDWLVGLDHVAAIQYAQAQRGGVLYRRHHVFVVETDKDDLLSRIWLFFEHQAEADAFFAKLED